MNTQECLAQLRRVTIRQPLFGTGRFWFEEAAHGYVVLRYEASVPDRDTGKIIPVRSQADLSVESIESFMRRPGGLKDYVLHVVRAFLLDACSHEVDEMLSYDGKIVRDPHRGEL